MVAEKAGNGRALAVLWTWLEQLGEAISSTSPSRSTLTPLPVWQVEGTGPAYPPVDSSSAIADQLFAPFPEDLFSAELDVHALKKMLTQPLTAQVPVISSVFTQYCLLMPALYRSSTTENARGLISRFDSALAQLRPTGSGSELNHTGFWDSLGFKLPEFAQQYMDCGVSCSRGVEDESIASPKGKRDYICLVDNMLVMSYVWKAPVCHSDWNCGTRVEVQYNEHLPGSGLQELFPAMEVTSPTNRQKALLMFINLVQWVRSVHDQHVLPMHRHQLFRSMPRQSPYPDLIGYHLPNQVTLKLNHVTKDIAVPFSHLDTLVKTYKMLASGAISGACQDDKLEVDGVVVNLRAKRSKLPVAPGDVGLITLTLRPVGMHLHIANSNELLNLIKQLLATLTALHKQHWVHRDIRMDNLVYGPTGWVLIDWELAALAGQHVFWNSAYLPLEVNAGQMPYTAACDLWQVGRIIQQYNALNSEAMKHFANQLTSKYFEFAEHALHAMPEV
ncbi:hypothetical protein WJX77_010781 [Trebouxia sp. C0004]